MNRLEDIPKVSVVMPVHNCEQYIQSAIDSILNQSFSDFEFIIIDDGSTDNTSKILAKNRDDIRIRIFSQPKKLGIPKTLNNAISLCRGLYIARQDADDLSHPNRLSFQVDFMDKYQDMALVGTWAETMDMLGNKESLLKLPCNFIEIHKKLLVQNCFIHGSVLIRHNLLKEVGIYDEKMELAQDYDLWLRMSEKFKLSNIPKYLYCYRIHFSSVSNKMKNLQRIYKKIARQNALMRRGIY